jgi:signal transduction histidine kinase
MENVEQTLQQRAAELEAEIARRKAAEVEAEGLPAALRHLAAENKKLYGVACAIHCTGGKLKLDEHAGMALYRISQEAIRNAIAHGKATAIDIRLKRDDHGLTLVIRDNGRGLPTEFQAKGGMGLRIMQYRAAGLGGSAAIQNDPGGGAVVKVSCPKK